MVVWPSCHSGNDGVNNRIQKLGNPLPGDHPDSFTFLHSVCTNSVGDIYAAEVSFVEVGVSQKPFPREMMSLRYWKRVKN